MVGEHAQRREVVEVVLDLGPVGHGEAHRGEQLLGMLLGTRDGVEAPGALAAARQRHVDGFGREAAVELPRLQRFAPRLDQPLDLGLRPVDCSTRGGAFLERQLGNALRELRE
jgi:hypothetical protein